LKAVRLVETCSISPPRNLNQDGGTHSLALTKGACLTIGTGGACARSRRKRLLYKVDNYLLVKHCM